MKVFRNPACVSSIIVLTHWRGRASMFIDALEQMSTGVSAITSIAIATLEIIHNPLLSNEPRLWFASLELLGNLAARKQGLDNSLEPHTNVMQCDVMWCDVMWCDVMWCDVMWCDVMWCDVMWGDVMSCMSCHVMSCMPCHVMSCHVMSCHVTSRHVTSRQGRAGQGNTYTTIYIILISTEIF